MCDDFTPNALTERSPLMFFAFAGTLVFWMAVTIVTRGPRAGLWWGWVTSLLLLPTWVDLRIGALNLDARTVAAVLGLAVMWQCEPRKARIRWRFADALVIALVAVQVLSELMAGPFGMLTVAEVGRVWLMPYVVGRVFLRSVEDMGEVLHVLAAAISVLSLYAIAEAITHINLANVLMGRVYGFLEGDAGHRWGLKRAQAVFGHPLYLGYLLALLLPWAIEARRRSRSGTGPAWWKYLPLVTGAALLCTASRGPIVAGLAAASAPALFARARLRAIVLVAVAIVVAGTLLFQDAAVDAVSRVVGEKEEDAVRIMIIHGREVEYTGTVHRMLLFDVYRDALASVDLFGYGAQLEGIDTDEIPQVFRSIDCHYLLLTLQHGYPALVLFVALTGATLVSLWRVARDASAPLAEFAAGLFGAVTLVTAFLFTVWWSSDFGFVWLFTAGLAGSLSDRTRESRWIFEPPTVGPQPRLVAAHAPLRTPAGA